ncbi:uncharacterized protein LODBEIA_P39690 [Lodderomyces beijingensis]|uniref:Cytochrome P450 n=1 Tax=Lodderomyces beijingensis TaxID=1775926 RepID=A0ABP0ZNL8_9ASCO
MVQSLVVLLAATFFVYTVVRFAQRRQLVQKYNCEPISVWKTSDWVSYFGLDVVLHRQQLQKEGRMNYQLWERFQKVKSSTFKQSTVFRYDIMTTEPENLRHMQSSAAFSSWSNGSRPKALYPLLGDGIFSSEGATWKHSRNMLRPFFNKEHIKHITLMEPFAQDVIKLCEQHGTNGLDLQEVFQSFTMDFSTMFLLGESCDSLKDALGEGTSNPINKELKRKFPAAFDAASSVLMVRLIVGELFLWMINPKPFQDAIKVQHDFVRYYIDKAIAMDHEELEKKSDDGSCFLYEIVKHTKNPKILQDEIMSIILAGRNTTSSLLSFLFLELAREENQHIWNKLKSVVGRCFPSIESITYESMSECTYLRWCLFETLRFNPSVPLLSRSATRDTVLPRGGGKDNKSPVLVHKGQRVIYSLFAANRNPDYFGADPHLFNPERFATLPRNGGQAFMPFGVGLRSCLGQSLALAEASYLTIRLVNHFDSLEKVGDAQYPPRCTSSGTQRLMDGCHVRISKLVHD